MSVTPLNVRTAREADLPRLLQLYRYLNPDDAPASDADARTIFAQFTGQPGNAIFAGFIGDALVTSCTLIVIPNLTRRGAPYALIENVVTHADHRRAGHGRAVLKAAVAAAWAAGCYKVMLLTGRKDAGTLAFICGPASNNRRPASRSAGRRRGVPPTGSLP